MPNSNKLAEVVAKLHEREEEYLPFEMARVAAGPDEWVWPLSGLAELLGYEPGESIDNAVNRAKISASHSGWSIKENFRDGSLFDRDGELFLTKDAALMVMMNADPRKKNVALAQDYFIHKVNLQVIENEKRLKGRLDVATENQKLTGIAQDVGVRNFGKFNGSGISALYGDRTVASINLMKGLARGRHYLDYAGSEELAANLFRITQTAAALRRQETQSEERACRKHREVASGVRHAILDAGNTPPERLPPAEVEIGRLATQVKRELTGKVAGGSNVVRRRVE